MRLFKLLSNRLLMSPLLGYGPFLLNTVAYNCLCLCVHRSLDVPNGFDEFFIIKRVIQEDGLYVFNL
jgi:hypothetical protein